jgi:cytochrome c biogenesis protein CcmG, thiol:disulfide interchange protein DsbE
VTRVPRSAIGLTVVAIIVVLVVLGVIEAVSRERDQPATGRVPDYARALAGAPAPLAALHDQAGELLDGGAPAFEARLRELRGYPVVVNKWASWCGPCRTELPYFQRQAARQGRRVAFLGVDSNDGRAAARQFDREHPVPYPHFFDPKLEVAKRFDAVLEFPSTAFYDRRGRLRKTHRGVYPSERRLAADIERYAR